MFDCIPALIRCIDMMAFDNFVQGDSVRAVMQFKPAFPCIIRLFLYSELHFEICLLIDLKYEFTSGHYKLILVL